MKPLIIMLCLAVWFKASAIMTFTPEGRQLTPPPVDLGLEAWELHGQWQGCSGIPIAPDWFITVRHIGVFVGSEFRFKEERYTAMQAVEVPQTDLLLYKVDHPFPIHAQLWDQADTVMGRDAVIFGRGMCRGAAIDLHDGRDHGWLWGAADGRLSWGTCVISGTFDAGPVRGPVLTWPWRAGLRQTDGTLTNGDSGGGLFLKEDDGRWKLAGLHFDCDPNGTFNQDTLYSLNQKADLPFHAAIHDGRGLWKGIEGESYTLLNPASPDPLPMLSSATPIAPYAEFIRAVIAPGSTLGLQYPPRLQWSRHKLMAAGCVGVVLLLSVVIFGIKVRRKRSIASSRSPLV